MKEIKLVKIDKRIEQKKPEQDVLAGLCEFLNNKAKEAGWEGVIITAIQRDTATGPGVAFSWCEGLRGYDIQEGLHSLIVHLPDAIRVPLIKKIIECEIMNGLKNLNYDIDDFGPYEE